jgi:hypothetical protein
MLKKERILFSGGDLNLRINLTSNDKFSGLQQEIDDFTTIKSAGSINDITDGEIMRFSLFDSKDLIFYFSGDTSWSPTFETIGFTEDEILGLSENYRNSFFILDFFDSTSFSDQTKIFSTYLTKLDNSNTGGNPNASYYNTNSNFQWNYLKIPKNFIDQYDDFITGYCRFSFYNAKTGNITVFSRFDARNSSDPKKIFQPVEINLNTNEWDFLTFEGSLIRQVEFAELRDSEAFVEKYNDSFDNFDNQAPEYPSGNTFNYVDGKYVQNT